MHRLEAIKRFYQKGSIPWRKTPVHIPKLLKAAGYTTGIFGKWAYSPGSTSEPLKIGFDRFYGYNCQRIAHHYYPYFLWNDNAIEVLWDNFGMETGSYV